MIHPTLLRLPVAFLLAILLLPAWATAQPTAPSEPPDRIERYHSDNMTGGLGLELSRPLAVRVMGKERLTMFGSRQRRPVGQAPVRFRLDPQAAGWGARLLSDSSLTDAGGIARVGLVLGKVPGRYLIHAEALGADGQPAAKTTLAVVGGVIISGGGQDARSGETVAEPLKVMVERAPGEPLVGAEVALIITEAAGKARVSPDTASTNADGEAVFQVTPGTENGRTTLHVNVQRPMEDASGHRIMLAEVPVSFYTIAPLSLFILIGGGLAIFIFGMTQLSEALTMIAGENLRHWLNLLTRNRVLGLAAGAIITGLLQSSSTTSVMVIGFVNAGLFQLRQAISVIFGANIGTTVTAQMISFNLTHLALPAIAAGVIMLLVTARERPRHWGVALVGFGLIFLGLGMMSSPLKELRDSHLMQSFFTGLSCAPIDGQIPLGPVLKCILIGAVTTAVVQSSSAAIGLLLTLVGSGLLDVWTAFPILLGDNIGTTVTAMLASIGTNRTSRRLAVSHVLFNVLGVMVMVLLLLVPWHGRPIFMEFINYITPGDAFMGENVERWLANAHTMFNISAALIFLPFIGAFAWVSTALVRKSSEEGEEERITYLEPHLLATPVLAMAQVYRELGYMSTQGRRALRIASEILESGPNSAFERQYERIHRREARLDRLQDEILNYIEQISRRHLSENESRLIPRLIHAVNDAERIGDRCVAILKLLRRIHRRQMAFDPATAQEIGVLFNAVLQMYDHVVRALEEGDRRSLERALAQRKQVGLMVKDLRKAHLTRLEGRPDELRSGMTFIEMMTHLEEVAVALSSIIAAYQATFAWVSPERPIQPRLQEPSAQRPQLDHAEDEDFDEDELVGATADDET